MRRFRGQTIQLSGPERVLPTESTGIDLRDARERNRPPREGGYEDRPRRFERDERSFDDAPRRTFRDRDEGDAPRRAVSKRAEDEPARGDDEECWRTGPPRTASSGVSRFDNEAPPERRMSRRSGEEETTAADQEEDWRAGAAPRVERRVTVRNDDVDQMAPRRFGSRQEVVDSRADDDDWRRGVPEVVPSVRIERTRSIRPPTKDEEEGDWRKPATPASHSATPWARKPSVQETVSTPQKPEKVERVEKRTEERKPIVQEVKKSEEAKWSSSEDEEGPDMQKIGKFALKVEKLIVEGGEECGKKIDAIIRKIPVNFTKAELTSLEPMKAVINIILNADLLATETEVERHCASVAPLLVCLESLYIEHSDAKVTVYQENLIEEIQKFVASIQLPRLNPQTSLVEQLWLSLYEQKVIAEESFKLWLDNDTLDSPAKSTTLFQTEAFRAWLYQHELPGVEATQRFQKAPQVDKDEWSDSDDSDIEALVPKRITGIHLRPAVVAPLRR